MKRRFTKIEKGELLMIADVIANEGHDVDELTKLLGISVEDMIERFGDRLLENRELFLAGDVHISEDLLDELDEDDEAPEGSWD